MTGPHLAVQDDVVTDADVDDVLGDDHEVRRGVHGEMVPSPVLQRK